MWPWVHVLEHFVENFIGFLIIILELFGALTIIYGSVVLFFRFLRLDYIKSSTKLRIRLARTISLGLQFYLAGEIFRLVSVREPDDLIIVAVIIILHVIISVLISWELGHSVHLAAQEPEEERAP